ncbi:MAG TPA: ABC transporter substrate-binding protein [Stellaceae bacterium]|nr:ABC transporter substrate-binding protein [Stellaceae bacterium]
MGKETSRRLSRRAFGRGAAAAGALVAAPALLRWRAGAAEPVKIGVLLPRSGFLALIGQACQRGCDIAVPVLKDMGYAVELMNADTESSPDVARTQAEKLIREGAHVIVGAFESGATAAIAQVAEQKGTPCVINIGSEPKITEQGYKFVFRNFPTSPMLVTNGLNRMKSFFETTGTTPKTAVLMHVNDTFGQSMLAGINALAPKIGLPFKIVETIAYDPKTRDLSIEVAKAKAAGAELHMVVTRLNDAILMIREMVKQKYEPMGVISPGSPGMYEGQFLKTLGKYADYCVSNVPWINPKQEMSQTLEKAFHKAYPDQDFDLNIGFSFEGIQICADAAKRAGSNAPQALVEALKATHIEKRVMIGGPIRFAANGQNPDQVSAAVQNRGGKPLVVLPPDSAAEKPVFPVPGWQQRT